MRKYIILLMFLSLLAGSFVVFLPKEVLAANVLTFDQNTLLSLTNPAVNITVSAGATIESLTVGASTIDVTIAAGGSITLSSLDRKVMTASPAVANANCQPGQSTITLTSSAVVTVSASICNSGSSGGGGGGITLPTPEPTTPETTTGQVTANAVSGGKTTLTTAENTTAKVEFPVNALSADTSIKIEPVKKTDIAANSSLPTEKNIIGSYVYNFTAIANGQTVSNFLKSATFTFTYTDSQISGLDEASLSVYYWNETTKKWVAISSVVDIAKNKITVIADHFTYFAIMGEKTASCKIANKTLAKATGQTALYWIYSNKRHVIPHSAVYHSWGLPSDFSAVKTVSTSDLNSCPEGDAVSFRDGSMFRGTAKSVHGKDASAVFFVSDGKLKPIKSGEIYQKMFNDSKWTRVTWVPDDLLSKFSYPLGDIIDNSTTHFNGSIVKYADSPAVYLIENGKKRLFTAWNNLLNNGFKKTSIITISKTEKYEDGGVISNVVEELNLPKAN